MSEMIERVAKAIWGDLGGWDDLNGDTKETVRKEARAAIAAMREPTEAMLDTTVNPHCVETMEDIRDVWTDMIDAALSDV